MSSGKDQKLMASNTPTGQGGDVFIRAGKNPWRCMLCRKKQKKMDLLQGICEECKILQNTELGKILYAKST